MTVRRLSAGVAPSKTNTGRILWKSSLWSGVAVCAKRHATPADAPEEAQQVGVWQHVTLVIAHGFDKLDEPNGSVCRG